MRDTPTFVVLYDTMYYVYFYSVYLYMDWRIERGRRSWLAWFCYLYKSFWRFLRRFGKRADSLSHILCVVSDIFIVHVGLLNFRLGRIGIIVVLVVQKTQHSLLPPKATSHFHWR